MCHLLCQTLDRGEAEAITLALEYKGSELLIDETDGRRVATSYNVDVTGTLGILVEAKEEKLISEVKPIMDKLIYAKFRVSKSLYQKILKKAGEL